jgi:hypothetical protein
MGLQHLAYDGARREVHHHFYEMKIADVNKINQFNAWIIKGTRNFHQVKSVGLDKIFFLVHNLSCFCKYCCDGGDGPCENEAYVAPFNLIHLKPYNPLDECLDVEHVHQLLKDQKVLTTTIKVGDNFAVLVDPRNVERSDFWIIICEKPLHVVEKGMKEDNWG